MAQQPVTEERNSFNSDAAEFGTPRETYSAENPCGACGNCLQNADDLAMVERIRLGGSGAEILGRPRECLRIGQNVPLRRVSA